MYCCFKSSEGVIVLYSFIVYRILARFSIKYTTISLKQHEKILYLSRSHHKQHALDAFLVRLSDMVSQL